MMPAWQTILDLYLQGEGTRAEVESLRLRLQLSPGDRAEIESALRLADRLENAASLVLPPLDGPQRMLDRLREHIGKSPSPNPRWLGDLSDNPSALRLGRQDDASLEDAMNAVIEGNTTTISSPASNEQLRQFEAIAQACADPSTQPVPPAGAQNRLLARLHEFQQTEAGAIDPAVRRRLLSQAESTGTESQRLPDLKAAAIDEENTEDDQGKSQGEGRDG
jgi:hypothetical protein